jgi:hypothetical protein
MSRHHEQTEAIRAATKAAEEDGTEVVVHDRRGRIKDEGLRMKN